MKHPFIVGEQYCNRKGAYTVLEIGDEKMSIRFTDGQVKTVKIELQAQIWQSIQDEGGSFFETIREDHHPQTISPRPIDFDTLGIEQKNDFGLQLAQLEGKTLATLAQHKRFDIVSVRSSHLQLFIHSTGMERRLGRNEIDPAWKALVLSGHLTRIRIRDEFSDRNPAYVAAILRAMPGVHHRLIVSPKGGQQVITLFYQAAECCRLTK